MQITIDAKKFRELLFTRKKENFGKFIRKRYGNVFADLMKATAIRKIVISSSCLANVIPNNVSYNEIMSLAVPSSWLDKFSIDEMSLAAFGVSVTMKQPIEHANADEIKESTCDVKEEESQMSQNETQATLHN